MCHADCVLQNKAQGRPDLIPPRTNLVARLLYDNYHYSFLTHVYIVSIWEDKCDIHQSLPGRRDIAADEDLPL